MTEAMEAIREQIDKERATDGYVPQEAAERIVKRLMKENPKALSDWLASQAVRLIRLEITDLVRSQRGSALANIGRDRFAAAVESGDAEALGVFATWNTVDKDNRQIRLADMTGPDHSYVAAQHTQRAETILMRAAFHRALAKKCGAKRTADVMTEVECEHIWTSLQPK